MPATVTLTTATMTSAVGVTGNRLVVSSTAGMVPGIRLFIEGELMAVVGSNGVVDVKRGVDGTAAAPHSAGATIYIGRADQFYQGPPVGIPAAVIEVSPYIDTLSGAVWFAQGDPSSPGTSSRYWQQQTVTRTAISMGFRSSTLDPTSST